MIGRRRANIALTAWLAFVCPARALAANVVVNYLDAQGTGFFDTSPIVPPPGSSATTLGEARRIAFSRGAAVWASELSSRATIQIAARMEPLTCSPTSGILGEAGPTTVHVDFPGATTSNTWFTQALANALASDVYGREVDLDPQTADITATFSSVLDDLTCLGATSWYYGLDGAPLPQTIDFMTVVVHELAHGLGLLPLFNPSTGAEFSGRQDIFTTRLEQHSAFPASLATMTDAQRVSATIADPSLHWVGPLANAAAAPTLTAGIDRGHLRMHGPNPLQAGSSLAHISNSASPNDLMEPFYTGANHNPRLAAALLRDLGWQAASATPVPAVGRVGIAVLCCALLWMFARPRVRLGARGQTQLTRAWSSSRRRRG
ncbi:MAG: hypothetical protein RLZZ450_1407 [Pseudomonadota bacterium]|jgi:hypothetical protein